ncbi:uncharacterized [Tachysurus ichikawai]
MLIGRVLRSTLPASTALLRPKHPTNNKQRTEVEEKHPRPTQQTSSQVTEDESDVGTAAESPPTEPEGSPVTNLPEMEQMIPKAEEQYT